MSNDAFEIEMKQVFLEEAQGLVEELEAALMALDTGDSSQANLDKIFRLAHNFKGSARAVGFDALSGFAHKMEDGFSPVKQGKIPVTPEVGSTLLAALDVFRAYCTGLKSDPAFSVDSTEVERRLLTLSNGIGSASIAVPTPESNVEAAPKIHSDVSAAPEMASAPVAAVAPVAQVAPVRKSQGSEKKSERADDEPIRVSTRKLDTLITRVGEIVLNQSMLSNLVQNPKRDFDEVVRSVQGLNKLVHEIRDLSMSLRMVPMTPLFQKLRRTCRDVATAQSKSVEFETEGEHVELDKTVLDRISDPLTHIIRNAVDHGIEDLDERSNSPKQMMARVLLSAQQREDRIIITVKDDGRGLNPEKLVSKAKQKGLIRQDAVLSDSDAYALIFAPGFSTKEQVTEVSGRGVGMDVVARAVEELKGTIEIQSKVGEGSTFTISLPLSLSIFSGMVIGVDQRRYIVPVSQLVETIEFQKQSIESVTGKGRMLNLRGEVIPVFSLSQILHGAKSGPAKAASARQPGIITVAQGKKVSFEIDEILGQQQIVLKHLGSEMEGIPGVTAGAILGDGEPGLVLNLQDFIKSAGGTHGRRAA